MFLDFFICECEVLITKEKEVKMKIDKYTKRTWNILEVKNKI